HEVNAAARAVGLIAGFDICGASRSAQTTMHAVEQEFVVDVGLFLDNGQRHGWSGHEVILNGASRRASLRALPVYSYHHPTTNLPGLRRFFGSIACFTFFISGQSPRGSPQMGSSRFHTAGQRVMTRLP